MPADMPAEAGANSWRDKHCPNHKLGAATLVYTEAPQIFERTAALSRDTSSSPLAFGS